MSVAGDAVRDFIADREQYLKDSAEPQTLWDQKYKEWLDHVWEGKLDLTVEQERELIRKEITAHRKDVVYYTTRAEGALADIDHHLWAITRLHYFLSKTE